MLNNPDSREKIAEKFVEILPILRKRLEIRQEDLADRIGVTRQMIIYIESKKRPLVWSVFLSMLFLFFLEPKTRPILLAFGIISPELSSQLFGDKAVMADLAIVLEPGRPMLAKAHGMAGSVMNEQNQAGAKIRSCLACDNEIPMDEQFCGKCGTAFIEANFSEAGNRTYICKDCHYEVPDGNKFCGKCGTEVLKANICNDCGHEIADGNLFCGACGAATSGDATKVKSVNICQACGYEMPKGKKFCSKCGAAAS